MIETDTTRIQKEATYEAMMNPQAGDHYTEMWNYHMFVVAVDADHIITAEASPPCQFPDDAEFRIQTPDAFRQRFAYGTIPGYWVRLAKRGQNVDGWLDGATLRQATA